MNTESNFMTAAQYAAEIKEIHRELAELEIGIATEKSKGNRHAAHKMLLEVVELKFTLHSHLSVLEDGKAGA